MMYIIGYDNNGTRTDFQWWVGTPLPHLAEIRELQADGDELKEIYRLVPSVAKEGAVITWEGDAARFLYEILKGQLGIRVTKTTQMVTDKEGLITALAGLSGSDFLTISLLQQAGCYVEVEKSSDGSFGMEDSGGSLEEEPQTPEKAADFIIDNLRKASKS